jgi:hypothetical protein
MDKKRMVCSSGFTKKLEEPKLTKAAMKVVESQLERLPHLDKWFVDIECPSSASQDS